MHLHIARFFGNASQDRGEIFFRHRWSDAWLQFTHHAQKFISPPFHIRPAWPDSVLGPDIRIWEKIREWRQHTHDCLTDAFKMDHPSDHMRIATKLVLPEIVGHDQSVVLQISVLARFVQPSEKRSNA